MAMLALSSPTAYLRRESLYMLSGNIQTDRHGNAVVGANADRWTNSPKGKRSLKIQ
jgi:hypothetical protein